MEKQQTERRFALGAFLAALASILLERTGVGSLIYTIPLILISYTIKDTRKAVLLLVGSIAVIAGLFLWDYRGLYQDENLALIALSAFISLIPGLFCIVYVALRDWSSSLLRKIVASSLLVAVTGLAVCIWLSGPRLEIVLASFSEAFNYVLQDIPELKQVLNVNQFSATLANTILFLAVPIGEICSVIPVLLAESAIHKLDQKWQSEFAFMKMPSYYIYVLMAFVCGLVLSYLAGLPVFFKVVLWNTTMLFCLHYLLNGLSLFFFWRRKANPNLPASRVIWGLILVNFLPGLGMLAILILVIIGILESWVEFR